MAKVKIQGHASGTGVLTVTAPNTSTDRTITLPDSTGTLATTADTGVAGITSSADATAITIDSSERVGIGAAPASGVAMTITKDGTGADMAGIRFIDSNSGNAQQIYNYQGNLYFRDATAGVTRIRVDSDGLKFGNDSAAANALDDYEEGTFTPTFNIETSSNISVSSAAGSYTKVGRVVYFTAEINFNKTSGINNVWISGLPFTSTNDSRQHKVIWQQGKYSGGGNYETGGTVSAANTVCYFVDRDGSSGTANWDTNNGARIANANSILTMITGFYTAA